MDRAVARRVTAGAAVVALLSTLLAGALAVPAAAAPGPFRPISPTRLMDTRAGTGGGVFGAGEVRSLVVAGTTGIPTGAVAVALNVTVTEPTVGGYVTVWPSGLAQPGTSNLNFVAGQTVPNMVTVGIGSGGAIAVANALGSTHVIVDVMGYFESGFTGVTPVRLMDTRGGLGGGRLGGADSRVLQVAGVGGIPADAVAVALNVTVTNPSLGGYVTVWPAGAAMPPSSNVNFVAGQTVPNMVLVGVGAGGQIGIFNASGSTDVLVDVMGWFAQGGGFTGVVPARVLDTRAATCGIHLGEGETRTLALTGTGGVPAQGVGAVALNVTATNPSQSSYLTVWPTGQTRPGTSNVNMVANQTVPNMVTVGVGAGGQVSFFNFGGTVDVIVDVMGYFDGDVPAGPLVPCPPQIFSFGDGIHVVGTAFPVGRYITNGAPTSCYWARTRGFSGAFSDIIANDSGSGRRIVDIKPGDVGFESSRCGTWSTFVASAYTPTNTFSGNGIYAVGSQVVPGRYVASSLGTSSCYWERTSGFSGVSADRLANDIGSGQRIVDIAPSDVGFESSSCTTWVPFVAAAYTPATSFGDGVYAVGSQIVPGRYQATNTTGCYWERTRGFSGLSADRITNDYGSGTRIVDIAPTDVGFESSTCGTWVRIG